MAAVPSPQDVYARHLASGRGYPLWTPEPNTSLPATYREGGLKIGDVGVVVPEDGSFDVFFNVTLPPAHILHQETGVPDNFTPIPLGSRDITVFPEAEGAGRVISTSSVTREKKTDTADGDLESRVEPGLLNYQFTLSSREGAVLILPEGAERCYLRNERPFLEAAMQHAVDWYTFAEERLGRIISHDSLYLITGFYKARSWSLAAYQQGAGTGEASAQFKAVQVGGGNIPTCYTWETTQAMDWRVGPSDLYYNGIPNQSVFISGFKIAVREGILGSKWVTVKADVPSARPCRAEFSSGPWFSNMWSGVLGSASGSSTSKWTGTGPNTDNNLDRDQPRDEVREDITIHRFPQVTKPFHPSDIINEHLLYEMPSATVAVTHDSQWTTLLQNGLLKPGELSQDRIIAEVASNYIPMLTHQGAVYLESRAMEVDVGDAAKMPATEHEGNPGLSPKRHDTQLSDSNLLTADGTSVNLYACAYGNFSDPKSCHAIYRTAHELQGHVTSAHALIVRKSVPMFRCGHCGLSWQRVEDLDYHIRVSNLHQNHIERQISKARESLPSTSVPIPPTGCNETEVNKMPLSCNFCIVRAIKCDRVYPACGGCQCRSLPCVYDDIKGKGKKDAESVFALSSLSSTSRESSSHGETGGTWSCRRCQVLGVQCHMSSPDDTKKPVEITVLGVRRCLGACARCRQSHKRCEPGYAVTAPKGASSSEGSEVHRPGWRARLTNPESSFGVNSAPKIPLPRLSMVNDFMYSTNESKEPFQHTTIEQAPVNLKYTTLRLIPLTPFGGGPLERRLYDLEFQFDCNAPKCEIRINQILPTDYPVMLIRTVIDGGMGRFYKFDEGTTLQNPDFKLFAETKNATRDYVAGPALPVLCADVAGTFDEPEIEKEFKDGIWEGVKLTICLSPLDVDGISLPTVDKKTTYLHINPTDDGDEVVKVIKSEAVRNSYKVFAPVSAGGNPVSWLPPLDAYGVSCG